MQLEADNISEKMSLKFFCFQLKLEVIPKRTDEVFFIFSSHHINREKSKTQLSRNGL